MQSSIGKYLKVSYLLMNVTNLLLFSIFTAHLLSQLTYSFRLLVKLLYVRLFLCLPTMTKHRQSEQNI